LSLIPSTQGNTSAEIALVSVHLLFGSITQQKFKWSLANLNWDEFWRCRRRGGIIVGGISNRRKISRVDEMTRLVM